MEGTIVKTRRKRASSQTMTPIGRRHRHSHHRYQGWCTRSPAKCILFVFFAGAVYLRSRMWKFASIKLWRMEQQQFNSQQARPTLLEVLPRKSLVPTWLLAVGFVSKFLAPGIVLSTTKYQVTSEDITNGPDIISLSSGFTRESTTSWQLSR